MLTLKRKADPSMFDIAGMKKDGRRIAQKVIVTYEESVDELQTDVELEHRVEIMDLPLRCATLVGEITAQKAIKDYFVEKVDDADYSDVAKLQLHLGILRGIKLQTGY